MSLEGRARAKLILFGEHAAVYGYPALGAPLDWELTLTLSDEELRICSHPFSLELMLRAFPEVASRQPLACEIQSEIPVGVGFGSSGALSAAFVRAVAKKYQLKLDHATIWERANLLEAEFHKTPSGIDTGLALAKGITYFQKDRTGEWSTAAVDADPIPCVIGAVPRRVSTRANIAHIRQSGELAKGVLKKLGFLSYRAKLLLEQRETGWLEALGEMASLAHSLLASLELSHPAIDQVLERGLACGACGGKISGGGGGGAFFLIAGSYERACRLSSELARWMPSNGVTLRPYLLT